MVSVAVVAERSRKQVDHQVDKLAVAVESVTVVVAAAVEPSVQVYVVCAV